LQSIDLDQKEIHMRKSAKQQGIEATPRIEKTKVLTLDQRIEIVDRGMAELNLQPVLESGKELADWLILNGYEPMMFAHACRIVQSRSRNVRA
jgi:hypothetical protein